MNRRRWLATVVVACSSIWDRDDPYRIYRELAKHHAARQCRYRVACKNRALAAAYSVPYHTSPSSFFLWPLGNR